MITKPKKVKIYRIISSLSEYSLLSKEYKEFLTKAKGNYEVRYKGKVIYCSNQSGIVVLPTYIQLGTTKYAYTQIRLFRK